MKQLISYTPTFVPGTSGQGYLDFSGYPGFTQDKLYAVINVTQNAIIYVPGATGLGQTYITGGIAGASTSAGGVLVTPGIVTLQYDTSSHSATDKLNVFYETALANDNFTAIGDEANLVMEQGGQIQQMNEMMRLMLVEMRITNILLQNMAGGLNMTYDDLNQLRFDLQQPETQEFTL